MMTCLLLDSDPKGTVPQYSGNTYTMYMYMYVNVSSFPRLLGKEKVKGCDHAHCLQELVNVCVLCNDSGLSYNEV